MTRDKNLMRKLLGKLEAVPMKAGEAWSITPDDPAIAVEGYSTDQIAYHLELLREGRYMRRYLNEVKDEHTPAGWNLRRSHESVTAAVAEEERAHEEGGEEDEDNVAPAADRFVTLDHNSAPYRETDDALERLAESIRGSNDLFANPEERLAVVAEVSAVRSLMAGTKVRLTALRQAATTGVIGWLGKEATSGAVRALAGAAALALLGLIAWAIKMAV